jgi:uncharacterized membrane protein YdjX (TVP38/TMEM64 family)
MAGDASNSVPRRSRLLVHALVATVVAGLLLAAWRLGLFSLTDPARLRNVIDRARTVSYAKPLFVVAYAVGSAVGVPATPLTLAGGALFGVGWGIILNWLGAMGGALLAFGVVRLWSGRGRGRVLSDKWRTTRSAMLLFRLRLVPVVPFAALNIGSAIAGMSWRSFFVATALGIVPIVVIYTVAAAGIVAGIEGSGRRAWLVAMASAVLITAATLVPRALRRRTATSSRA